MDEEPELPEPVPEIPRGALWRLLLIPPLITFGVNVLIGLAVRHADVAGFSMLLPLPMFFVIVGCAMRFSAIVGTRYRGRSLVFLSFSYFLGQIIGCSALWIGSCMLAFPPLNFH